LVRGGGSGARGPGVVSAGVGGAILTEPMRSARRRDPMSQEDVAIVRSIYDAFGRRDVRATMGLLHPEVEV
jgi:hypothetical protein